MGWIMQSSRCCYFHDDVIKWKHFPRYWPFVRGIHRFTDRFPSQRPVTLSFDVFFLFCAWTNGWANNRDVNAVTLTLYIPSTLSSLVTAVTTKLVSCQLSDSSIRARLLPKTQSEQANFEEIGHENDLANFLSVQSTKPYSVNMAEPRQTRVWYSLGLPKTMMILCSSDTWDPFYK